MAAPSEHDHQVNLFRWAGLMTRQHPELALMFAVPNAGKRTRRTGGRMVAEGLKSGVPDVCLPVPRQGYHGLWIELKKPGKYEVSAAQQWWLENLAQAGHRTALCVGWDEARETIVTYLEMPK